MSLLFDQENINVLNHCVIYSQLIDKIFTYVLILEITIYLFIFAKDKLRCQFSGPVQG